MIYFIGQKEFEMDVADEVEIAPATMNDLIDFIERNDVFGIDTETTGLSFIDHKVIMLQIGNETDQYVIDTRVVKIDDLKSILFENTTKLKIYHNGQFDIPHIKSTFGFENYHVYDTMVTEMVLYNGKMKTGYSLADLCKRYLDVTLDKSVRNRFIELKGEPYRYTDILYGARDVEYLIKIRQRQKKKYEGQEFEKTIELENQALEAFSEISYNGMYLNKEKWLSLSNHAETELLAQQTYIDTLVEKDDRLKKFIKAPQLDIFGGEGRKVAIEWSSPKQVLKLFKHRYDKKLTGVGHFELLPISTKLLVKEYLKYKQIEKKANAYGSAFFKNLHSDGKMHTRFKQILETGRVSSSNPNVQQIPGLKEYRACFEPEDKDYLFVTCDYSSQELMIIATKSKDPVWLEARRRGQDLHSVCAELIFGKDWKDAEEEGCEFYATNDLGEVTKGKCENCEGHRKMRTFAKTLNFGLAYGMGPPKLASQLQISQREASKLIDSFFSAFPRIHKFLRVLAKHGKTKGYIKTFPPYFRRRYFYNYDPSEENSMAIISAVERKSMNTPIQGCAADMVKRALYLIHREIKFNNWPVELVMTVHDQIDTICHKDYAEAWATKMKQIMEDVASDLLRNDLLKTDPTISKVWQK